MKRREFIGLVGGVAATWPLAAHAQQRVPVPVIGFLRPTTAADAGHLVAALRQGLRESGYSADKFVLEARWAEGHSDRLPKLAAEFVSLPVAVIVGNTTAAMAAKAATTSVPIVFVTGTDPISEKLVTSISRPGGNITGVSFFDVPVTGKRLTLLRELVPKAEIIATLQDPNFSDAQIETREIETAANAIGVKIVAVKTSRAEDIDAAFSTAVRSGAAALLVGAGPFFNSRRSQLIGLAAFHAIPTSYFDSAFVDSGGLISYGSSITDAYRRAGVYVARILKGEKPGELPVELPTRFELAINLKTAKALGLAVPPGLLARADHVIE
ncbi:MAG TPA: ABC transporter substrate-binding protein [Pseudolabrys sp.]|nr:ABC transporter substrate-binding protein [Pseudolabrys sp.]